MLEHTSLPPDPWSEPPARPISCGTLEGPGSRGDHDGMPLVLGRSLDGRLIAKLFVWHRNQQLGFELSLLDLGRLALGRGLKLPVEFNGSALYAEDVSAHVARRMLAVCVRDRMQELRLRRKGQASRVELRAFDVAIEVERRLAPWMLAILERLDKDKTRGAPS